MSSDRRAYVRIPDAILREPWDDATLADMVRIQAFLNTRWARDHLTAEEAGHACLGPQEMMLVTRTSNATRARRRLLDLRQRTSGVSLGVTEATRSGIKCVIFDWPNFPIEQGYRDRDTPQPRDNLGAGKPLPIPPPIPRPDTAIDKKESHANSRALAVSNKAPPIVAQGTLANPSPDARAAVDQLLLSIDLKLPGQAVPEEGDDRWRRWCHEIDLLYEIGEPGGDQPFSWEDIHAVLRWLPTHQNDDFAWGLVIRSASKLRKHFSRLLAESKRVKRPPVRQGGWHQAGQAVHREIEGGDRD